MPSIGEFVRSDVWPLLPLPMPELVIWKPKRSCRLRDRQKKRLQVQRAARGVIKVINALHTGCVTTMLTSSGSEDGSRRLLLPDFWL